MPDKDKLSRVAQILRRCQSILFITGAGISADSGLPTYRGIGGLYDDKETSDGVPIEMALAGKMLKSHPEITWKYLAQIEKRCRSATFNQAHWVIAQMQKHFKRVWVLTQNIDGFHRDAGSQNVIDIHGDMHNLTCPRCDWRKKVKDYSQLSLPPKCPQCQAAVRPEVVLFGEVLPENKLEILFNELNQGFDIYFSIGTTSVFPYIQEPILSARARSKPTVEINPSQTQISHLVDIKISLGAKEALGGIWEQYQSICPSFASGESGERERAING